MKGSGKSSIFFVFLVLLGALTGSLLGDMLGDISALTFLKHVYSIGTSAPFNLNLRFVTFTFGFNLNMNIMSIIGVIVAIILYRKY